MRARGEGPIPQLHDAAFAAPTFPTRPVWTECPVELSAGCEGFPPKNCANTASALPPLPP
eukprot:358331-Chlamydomonas_euryale.AAC.6